MIFLLPALRIILLAALVAVWAAPASAHPAPFSYLDLHLDASRLRGALVIHDFDAAHELGIDKPAILLDPEVAVRYRDRLVAIMQTRLRLSGDGRALSPTWGVIDVLPDRQSVRLPLDFGSETPGGITIDTVMFPYDPNHQTFINIYEKGELRHQAVLDARNAKLDYFAGTTQGRLAVIRTFVASGIHHIAIGPDLTTEMNKKIDELAKKKNLTIGMKASLEFRQFVNSHSDTIAIGPSSAADLVKAAEK